MKKFLSAFLLIVAASLMVVSEAEAARLGGGRTFGRQSPTAARQAPVQRQAAPQAANPQAAPTATPPTAPRPSPWRGILGGALLGLGLGALLSHFGIGGAMASMISTILMVALIGFAIMFIYRMLTRRKESEMPASAYAGNTGSSYGSNVDSTYSGYPNSYAGSATPEIGSRLQQPAAVEYVPYGVPGDFDIEAFVRSAKTHFIRLQAAWDRADIDDIREFTSPEMFAELKMQLQERGAAPNETDVVTLNAALLGIENVNNQQMASVQFTGSIRDSKNAPAVDFAEIWNLTRPFSGNGGWILAGIQQTS